jgi:GNAT superfamily N-acetyltransferase
MIRLKTVAGTLPAGFDAMREEARAERYNMLERLVSEWESHETRFDRDGEGLLAAYSGDVLAGIGGLTVEPAVSGAFRMRRFYVRSAFRRRGIARQLALAVLERMQRPSSLVTVNAATGSGPFWEALGFIPIAGDGWTHVRRQI